ncbi:MAG: SURF1 family protein [Pseudolabrys sp.]
MSAKTRGIVEPTVFAIVGIAILVGLGIWQLDRKVWKENLIAALNTRLSQPPGDLPPREQWGSLDRQREEFRRVGFPAEFLPGQEALVYSAGSAFRPDVKGPGYWVFAPARLAGGSIVIVDRGFVPSDRKDPATRASGAPHGSIDIVGIVRWPETRGMFTPADDVKGNVWYLRDIKAMAAAHHWRDVAPFYVEQESPVPPGGWPKPGKLVVNLPDNHLQYTITWFGLAFGLFAVYVVFMVRRFRRSY